MSGFICGQALLAGQAQALQVGFILTLMEPVKRGCQLGHEGEGLTWQSLQSCEKASTSCRSSAASCACFLMTALQCEPLRQCLALFRPCTVSRAGFH